MSSMQHIIEIKNMSRLRENAWTCVCFRRRHQQRHLM